MLNRPALADFLAARQARHACLPACAAPSYLAWRGEPQRSTTLAEHAFSHRFRAALATLDRSLLELSSGAENPDVGTKRPGSMGGAEVDEHPHPRADAADLVMLSSLALRTR